jgi:hypothetical protein
MKWSPHGSRLRFIYYFSSDRTALFVSLKDKTLVDAMVACGISAEIAPARRVFKGKSEVTDLGRTTVLKWGLRLCLGLAASTTDPDAAPGLKAKK